jgi:hypothetical protein
MHDGMGEMEDVTIMISITFTRFLKIQSLLPTSLLSHTIKQESESTTHT